MAEVTWRPTAASMRNLAAFWSGVGVAGVASAGLTGAAGLPALAVVLGLAAVGGWMVGALWSGPRVRSALDAAKPVRPKNWPPKAAARDQLARAGRRNAIVAVIGGTVGGALLGAIPVFGVGVAAAGVAGAIGTAMLWRTVHLFEDEHQAVVLTAQATRATPRRTLELGIASR